MPTNVKRKSGSDRVLNNERQDLDDLMWHELLYKCCITQSTVSINIACVYITYIHTYIYIIYIYISLSECSTPYGN